MKSRATRKHPRLRYLVGTVLLSMLCGAGAAIARDGAFYATQPGDLSGSAGSIVRKEAMADAPTGSAATRFIYRTTKADGTPTLGSAVAIVPQGPAPISGRPVIVWAHPTTGVVPACAPSLSDTFYLKVQGLQAMLDRGYVVVAPDYPGLGTEGPHAYLVGEAAARSVLDSVRALKSLPVGASERFAVWGHSQGGHASIFTGIVAHHYAPELQLVGVAAAAPATDLATLLRDDYATSVGKILTAMAVRSWTNVFNAPMDQIVIPEEIAAVNRVGTDCIESKLEIYEAAIAEIPLQRKFLSVPDITRVEPWRDIVQRNTPGPLPRRIPLLMIQGMADTIVEPAVTSSYVRRQCAVGSAVRFMQVPGIGHNPIARDTASAAVQWMAERFADMQPPNDCSAL